MGRANGIKQQQPLGLAPRGRGGAGPSAGPGPSADDILFGHLGAAVRPAGGARSFINQGIQDGHRVEFWTSDPDIVTVDQARDQGLLHREDGPAFVLYDDQERVKGEVWMQNGIFHRLDGPAVINYFENGMPETEQWFLDGREHRDDGPAEIRYDKVAALEGESVVEDEVWWSHGQLQEILDQ